MLHLTRNGVQVGTLCAFSDMPALRGGLPPLLFIMIAILSLKDRAAGMQLAHDCT